MIKKISTKPKVGVFGAMGAAVAASVCCTIPLLLVSLGVGGAWMSSLTSLAPFRPFFILFAVASLGFAFGRHGGSSRKTKCECEEDTGSSSNSVLLGVGALVTAGLIASSWFVSSPADDFKASNDEFSEVTFDVDRMTCESCATTVSLALERTEGVVAAQVTSAPPRAVVRYDPSKTDESSLMNVISHTGYPARRSSDDSDEPSQTRVDPMSPITPNNLRAAFNEHSDQVRLVAILSPTCPECIHGHEVVRQVFEHFESDDLSAMIAWIPMKPNDSPDTATEQALTFTDERVRIEGWDIDRAIGGAFEQTLGLTRTAWDVYMVYDAGVVWDDELPPPPSFWMHQLTEDAGADQQYCLNPIALANEVGKRLEVTD